MTRRLPSLAARFLSTFLAILLAIGLFTIAKNLGWLSPFGVESESHDSQVVRAIKRTQEISLLSLSIQGIDAEKRSRSILGQRIPGTGEALYLQYTFAAKLGIDGADVTVTKTGTNAYRISVPPFIFIGYDQPNFEVAVEDGGVLRFVTPDIDKTDAINKILSEKARQTYISSNEDLLKDQTKVFYDGLISSIDPDLVTTYEFREPAGAALR
jgi:hypothetical protein